MNFPVNPSDARLHQSPVLSIAPSTSNRPTVAVQNPMFPYPTMPFPGFPFGPHSHELQQINFLQSLQRSQQVPPEHQHKMKTPINRNYLELAMLVCNTFRGKLFPCPHCRYVTDRRNNLKRHISTMHQTCEKQLECCGVSFSTKASLREHIMIFHHNGYSCPYCGRRFCRKALLKRHLSVHSGQKDYTCPSCDYATSHKSNLERHKRIHERLKLGEDGSIFECGDFTSHQMAQSPDTTDNSVTDSKDDSFIDIESTDENSDVDVTEDVSSDNEKLETYPVFTPQKRTDIPQSSETLPDSSQLKVSLPDSSHLKASSDSSNSDTMSRFQSTIKDTFSPSYDFRKAYEQNIALDFSKARQSCLKNYIGICSTSTSENEKNLKRELRTHEPEETVCSSD